MSKILIRQGRVIDPASGFDAIADVLVVDDKIADVGTSIEADGETNVIEAAGKLVMPGAVDLHVHLRDFEESAKETIESGTLAARRGGVTTVFAMPNTRPRLDGPEALERYAALVSRQARVTVQLIGAISKDLEGQALAELESYPSHDVDLISDDGFDVNDESLLEEAYLAAARLGLTVVTHPEMAAIGKDGVINEGVVSATLHLPGQPNAREFEAVRRGIRLCAKTGARAHMTHVSTAESVQLVREAKKNGLKITCDATPHHIALTEQSALTHGTFAKVNPPLRTEKDRLALIAGLKDGTVDAIATDHAPHTDEEKGRPFLQAPFGISGLETLLPVAFDELHFKQGLDLCAVVKWLTFGPARIGKVAAGILHKGATADICVVDLNLERTVDRQALVSLGKNTPFHGHRLKGWPIITLVRGNIFRYDQ